MKPNLNLAGIAPPKRKHVAMGLGVAGLVVLALIPRGCESSGPDWSKETLIIATATPGGTYTELGGKYARILGRLDPNILKGAEPKPSAGALENIHLLQSGDADLAFVAHSALTEFKKTNPVQSKNLRILAPLYRDILQVAVKDTNIVDLSDLRGKTIYVGNKGSATRIEAERLLASAAVRNFKRYPLPGDEASYAAASAMLQANQIDAAVFSSGIPTFAVKTALTNGCRLLDLAKHREALTNEFGASPFKILPRLYHDGQSNAVDTVGSPVYLVCRKDLDSNLAKHLLDSLFDNIAELLEAHTTAREIRSPDAFDTELPDGFRLHRETVRFKKEEAGKLLIASGGIGGKYHNRALDIRDMLGREGIPTRVMHTDGSVENVIRLQTEAGKERTLAFTHYDIALAALLGPRAIYKQDAKNFTLNTGDLRQIVTLHKELVYVFLRRLKAPDSTGKIDDLEGLTVCLGPEQSGTRIVAQTLLELHDVTPSSSRVLQVDVMVKQLQHGEIDAGFFVSGFPSKPLQTILDDARFRLLSINFDQVQNLTSDSIFETASITNRYPCRQPEGADEDIHTLATHAMLVAHKDAPDELVGKITRTLFSGGEFLEFGDRSESAIRKRFSRLKLHKGAEEVYRDLGFLPTFSSRLLEITAHVVGILVVIFGAFKGASMLLRERLCDVMRSQILAVPIAPYGIESVREFATIRQRIREFAQKN